MTTFVAELPIERRTLSGYKQSTLFGYGDSPHEAFSDVYASLAFSNRGQDRRTPLVRQVGKAKIRREK